MDIALLFQRSQVLGGAHQLADTGGEGFLMFLDFTLFKQILRDHLHMVCAGIKAVGKASHIENFGAVQPQFEKDI